MTPPAPKAPAPKTPSPNQGKRVKCYLSRADYERLRGLKERFGFRSEYELCSASLRVMMAVLERKEQGRLEDLPDELQEVFDELYNTEQYPLGRKPKRADNSNFCLLFPELDKEKESLQTLRKGNGILGRKYGSLGRSVTRLTEDRGHRSRVKEWADDFIRSYADVLRKRVEQMPRVAKSHGFEPLDILNDTLLGLYDCTEEFEAYVDFERWAIEKFRSVCDG